MSKLVLENTMEENFFLAEWKLKIREMDSRHFSELQDLSIRLLEALVMQKAATRGMMQQALGATFRSHKEFLEKESAASEPG